jgi:signal peptidase I
MRRLFRTLLIALFAVAVGLVARTHVISLARVAGDSMADTLCAGDIALVTKFDYAKSPPERFDVVLMRFDGRDGSYLKRVIGLPGDEIVISGGQVHINGMAVDETYAETTLGVYAVTLGTDEFFVLGDNRQASYDSREEGIGAVRAESFLGRVRAVVWPLARFRLGIE